MKLVITGGCGFLGSNLAARALQRGDELILFDNLTRRGSSDNLHWLQTQGDFRFVRGDVREPQAVAQLITDSHPDAVFHLAGQVAMTTSIADPRLDFEVNALGSLNILEAVRRHAPSAIIVYSSTNKVYGDLEQYSYRETDTRYECVEQPSGFDENTPLSFHSPYGCSKGAADQYMLDYARIYDLRTVVFRHSSMYGGRQYATYDQGWIGWFCQKAIQARGDSVSDSFEISGTGKQVRDVLHADDMVTLYFAAVEHIAVAAGEAFNVGGGMPNSLSLLELFSLLEELCGVSLRYRRLPPRISDQRVFMADIGKAQRLLGWSPRVDSRSGITRMLKWLDSLAVAGPR